MSSARKVAVSTGIVVFALSTPSTALAHQFAALQSPEASATRARASTHLKLVEEQIIQSETGQVKLRLQNEGLRQEIQRWRDVAGHVAEREAWAANVIQKAEPTSNLSSVVAAVTAAAPAQAATAASAAAVAPVLAAPVAFQQSSPTPGRLAALQSAARLATNATAATAAAAAREGLSRLQNVRQNAAIHLKSTAGSLYDPMTSYTGIFVYCSIFSGFIAWGLVVMCRAGCYKHMQDNSIRIMQRIQPGAGASHQIDISEVHFGDLLCGKDMTLTITADRDQSSSTKVAHHSDGSFVRFSETFSLDVKLTDAPIVIRAVDKSGELARMQISAEELISLSERRHREFYRASLEATGESVQALAVATGRTPYAAMRIRLVTPKAAA